MECVWNVARQSKFRSFCDQTNAPSILRYIDCENVFLHIDLIWSERNNKWNCHVELVCQTQMGCNERKEMVADSFYFVHN